MPTISVTIRSPYWRMSRRKGGRTRSRLAELGNQVVETYDHMLGIRVRPGRPIDEADVSEGHHDQGIDKNSAKALRCKIALERLSVATQLLDRDQKGSRFAGYQRPPMTSIRPRVPLTSISVTAYSVTTSTSISYLRLSRSRRSKLCSTTQCAGPCESELGRQRHGIGTGPQLQVPVRHPNTQLRIFGEGYLRAQSGNCSRTEKTTSSHFEHQAPREEWHFM